MYQLKTTVVISASLEKVWDFFSSPANLKQITPQSMGFDILEGGNGKMYPGQIISYRVRPLMGIPVKWVTEITHVNNMTFFVDEQRIGPYKLWHHEHHFKLVDSGIEMTDIVSYQLPFGLLGRFAHFLFVKKKLHSIFAYRTKVIREVFP